MATIIDLTCPFDREYSVPQYLHHTWRLQFRPLFTFARDGQRVMEFIMSTHTGTHVDAPSHVIKNGKNLDDFPLSTFHGPAAVLDVPKGECEKIEIVDLQRARVGIQAGDIVLLCTGWGKYYVDDPRDTYYLASKQPGLSVEAAQWLVEKKVKGVGIDTFSIRPAAYSELNFDRVRPGTFTERIIVKGKVEPVHEALLGRDVLVFEQLTNLQLVAGKRITVSLLPLPLQGMDGAPIRAIAFID